LQNLVYTTYFRVQKIRQACPAGEPATGLTHVLAALDGSGFGRENNTAGLFERQEKSKERQEKSEKKSYSLFKGNAFRGERAFD